MGLLERATKALLADKGYGATSVRPDLADRNIKSVIPARLNRRVKFELVVRPTSRVTASGVC